MAITTMAEKEKVVRAKEIRVKEKAVRNKPLYACILLLSGIGRSGFGPAFFILKSM